MLRSTLLAALLATSCSTPIPETRDVEYSFISGPNQDSLGFAWRGPQMAREMEVTWSESNVDYCGGFNRSPSCVRWSDRYERMDLDRFDLVLHGPDGEPVDAILEPRMSIGLPDGWLEPGPYTLHAHWQGEPVAEANFEISADGTGDSSHPLAEGAFDERYILEGITPDFAFGTELLVRLHQIGESPVVSVYANADEPDRRCRAYQGPITHEVGGYSHASAAEIEVGRDPTFFFETLDLQLAVNHDSTLTGIELTVFGHVEPFILLMTDERSTEDDIDLRRRIMCNWGNEPPFMSCEPCTSDPDTECINISLIHGMAERTDEPMELDDVGPCTAPSTGGMECSVVGTGLVGGWGLGLVLLLLRRREADPPEDSGPALAPARPGLDP